MLLLKLKLDQKMADKECIESNSDLESVIV